MSSDPRDPDEPIDSDGTSEELPDETAPDFGFSYGLGAIEEMPRELYSCFAEAPFAACIECGRDLTVDPVPYGIQKVRRGGETIFEFALCMPCMEGINGEMSEESRLNIETFIAQAEFHSLRLEACNLCGRSSGPDLDEAVICGLGWAGFLVEPPRSICVECADGLERLLSKATRDQMGDFTTRNFPGVPADVDLPVGLAF